MPKQSKLSSSRLKEPPKPVEERTEFYCCRCGKKYKKQKGNFSLVSSTVYKGNNGYLPVCHTCIDEMYAHYRDVLGTPQDAIRRLCSKFDIYWNEAIFKTTNNSSMPAQSRMRLYISRSNIQQYYGRTYDDTLDEERGYGAAPKVSIKDEEKMLAAGEPDIVISELTLDDIDPEIIDFWGRNYNYTPEVYLDLDRRFVRWTEGNVSYAHDDPAQESILKQLCILERRIETGGMTGAKISEDINAYNALMGSANLKPSQKKADAQSSDGTPFGVWIQRWENEQPIPEPDPDFADADGIVRYISIWFLGHLCKTLKIKNSYSRMYEEEIERLRVERPEYAGEDDEEFFQDVFDTGGG